jgi:hypothetical protein
MSTEAEIEQRVEQWIDEEFAALTLQATLTPR